MVRPNIREIAVFNLEQSLVDVSLDLDLVSFSDCDDFLRFVVLYISFQIVYNAFFYVIDPYLEELVLDHIWIILKIELIST
jgi:hypothetical protein